MGCWSCKQTGGTNATPVSRFNGERKLPNAKRGKKKMKAPPLLEQAWRFMTTIYKHSKNDWKMVSKEQYAARLDVCETSGPDGGVCPEKKGSRCLACGCQLWLKAGMEIAECESKLEDRNKWAEVDEEFKDG